MRSDSGFLRVGVTGGIGSGKSEVCALFAGLGREVISADIIANEITETDDDVRRQLRTVFGEGVYAGDGRLNRAWLARVVFGDARRRKQLNGIVHPVVFRRLEARISSLSPQRAAPYIIIEAALIYESGLDRTLDCVIVVDADEQTRITRVMQRDGCTRDDVLRRIAAQMPAPRKVARADFVIRNERNATDLDCKVRFLDTVLRAI
jgi:dephospho-CoA kinase